NGAVVVGAVGKALGGEAATQAGAVGAVVLAQVGEYPGIVAGIDHQSHEGVVFVGGAQHGLAADIDGFDGRGKIAIRTRHGLLERVQVDHHHIDGVDALFGHDRVVGAAAGENAAVDFRVQRLDAAGHDFRCTGVGGDVGDVDTGV